MQLLRKVVLEKTITEFKFDVNCTKFLVKNLTSKNIFACIGDIYDESISSLILSNNSEYLEINENLENPTTTITVYSEIEGEIEVQALTYTNLKVDILDNLNHILNAVFGKDIRKAIHDSIQIINNKVLKLEKVLKKLIKNSTSESPSNAEIVQARGEYELLNDRLDEMTRNLSNLNERITELSDNSIKNQANMEVYDENN